MGFGEEKGQDGKMLVLKHGFNLGLVPNLLKTDLSSSRWPYLGKGEEEEPPDIWKALLCS